MEQKPPAHFAKDEEWDMGPIMTRQPERDMYHMLSGIEIFSEFTTYELHKVAEMLHFRTYLPMKMIVQQGAPGVGMYIIQTGRAGVQFETWDGRLLHLATLGEGQFFGEMSLLDGAPRAASVVALERVVVLGFFKADLMGLIDHSPKLGFKIISRVSRIMAQRLRGTLKEYREVTRQMRFF